MMMTKKESRNEKGFTLIEVLIAMVIFSIGILAVAQMQIRALHANSDAFAQTEATMWASNQAEILIGLPFSDANLTAGKYPANDTDPPNFIDPNNEFGLRWEITDVPPSKKQIEIKVEWTEKGDDKELDFDFVKTDSF